MVLRLTDFRGHPRVARGRSSGRAKGKREDGPGHASLTIFALHASQASHTTLAEPSAWSLALWRGWTRRAWWRFCLRNGADPLRVPVTLLEKIGESIETGDAEEAAANDELVPSLCCTEDA
jgi:hypothetical protein